MRVLVTGGAGFVGSHVAVALTDARHDVSCLDSLQPAAYRGAAQVGDGVRLREFRDPATVAEALLGVDAVVHQARINVDDLSRVDWQFPSEIR
jgi:dTDP-L-rhamnose 4-epimerase